MSYTHTAAHLTADDQISDGGSAESVHIGIDGPDLEHPAVTLFLPNDDDDATLVLDLLETAFLNARSRVAIRRRDRAHKLAAPGWDGAGASVEAQRG